MRMFCSTDGRRVNKKALWYVCLLQIPPPVPADQVTSKESKHMMRCRKDAQKTPQRSRCGAMPGMPPDPAPQYQAPSCCSQPSLWTLRRPWFYQQQGVTCLRLIPLPSCLHRRQQEFPNKPRQANLSLSLCVPGTRAMTVAPQVDPCSPTTTHNPTSRRSC